MQELDNMFIEEEIDGEYLNNETEGKSFAYAHMHALGQKFLQFFKHFSEAWESNWVELDYHVLESLLL